MNRIDRRTILISGGLAMLSAPVLAKRGETSAVGTLTASDKIEIAEAVTGIGLHADQRRWDRVLALMAPQIVVDYTSVFGGVANTTTREVLVGQWRRLLPGFDATQHLITNLLVEGAGEEATAHSHVRASHWIGRRSWTLGGSYTHRLIRSAEGWRVSAMTLSRLYEEGERTLVEAAALRAKTSAAE